MSNSQVLRVQSILGHRLSPNATKVSRVVIQARSSPRLQLSPAIGASRAKSMTYERV